MKRRNTILKWLDFIIWPVAFLMWLKMEDSKALVKFYSEDSRVGMKMLVVIPFANDIDQVERNVMRWSQFSMNLTKFSIRQHVDLVFYYHRDIESNRDVKERLESLIKGIAKSFNQVFLLSAHLDQWEDSYPLGPSKMFFKLVLETPVIQDLNYDSLFWMEPDCWPVRDGWLERLYKEATCNGPYWMVGSLKRDGRDYEKEYEPIKDHMNGNALYRIGDPNFHRYVEIVRDDFEQRMSAYLRSFDVALYLYRSRLPYSERSQFEHYFRYTPTIMNVYRTETNLSQVVEENPDVYLVHGRHLVE